MTDQEIDALVNEFWEDMEAEAAKLEVTVDYYVEEFMIWTTTTKSITKRL